MNCVKIEIEIGLVISILSEMKIDCGEFCVAVIGFCVFETN